MKELTARQKQYIDEHYKTSFVSDMAKTLKLQTYEVSEYMDEKGYSPKKSFYNNIQKKQYVRKPEPALGCFNYNEKVF